MECTDDESAGVAMNRCPQCGGEASEAGFHGDMIVGKCKECGPVLLGTICQIELPELDREEIVECAVSNGHIPEFIGWAKATDLVEFPTDKKSLMGWINDKKVGTYFYMKIEFRKACSMREQLAEVNVPVMIITP